MKAWEEKQGVTSMRRVLALYFSLLSGGCLGVAAWKGQIVGVYAGLVCVLSSLFLLGLCTVQEIKALIQYKLADAVGTGAEARDGEQADPIGFNP